MSWSPEQFCESLLQKKKKTWDCNAMVCNNSLSTEGEHLVIYWCCICVCLVCVWNYSHINTVIAKSHRDCNWQLPHVAQYILIRRNHYLSKRVMCTDTQKSPVLNKNKTRQNIVITVFILHMSSALSVCPVFFSVCNCACLLAHLLHLILLISHNPVHPAYQATDPAAIMFLLPK